MIGSRAERPLRRDAQRNLERIRAAALELFAEHGVDVTLDEVAERAGVGVGTVYRRYPNKDALLDDVFAERVAGLAARAEEALAEPDAWEALVGFLEDLFEGFVANRASEQLLLQEGRGERRLAHARERLQEPVAALVERAIAAGRLRPDFEPADIGMIARMLARVIAETQASSPDAWRRYFTMIVDGLATERAAPTPTQAAAPGRVTGGTRTARTRA